MNPSRAKVPTALVAAALLASACSASAGLEPGPREPAGAGPTSRYLGRPASFDYPAHWTVFDPAGQQEPGAAPTAQGPSSRVLVGLDELNRVVVSGFPADFVVTPENFAERRPAVVAVVEQQIAISGARIVGGPDDVDVRGQTALQWEVVDSSPVGYVISSTLMVVFRGARQYVVQCTRIPPHAAEIEAGCATILGSADFTYQAPL